MKDIIRILGAGAMLWHASTAWAQQAPPADAAPAKPAKAKATAQSEAGEPRASTGDPQADAAEPPSRAPPAPGTPAAGTAPAAGQKTANPRSAGAADKLQLGTATVTGDREQPKVMYVVPWKKADIGDAEGKPMNSLVDEILSPVDRDVFKREVRYYQTITSGAPQNGAPPAAEQVEK